jgi:hypothetical protein
MTPDLPERSREVIGRKVAGEMFLVPIRGQLADLRGIFALNPVAAFVWERFDARTGLPEIARSVSEAYEVEVGTALADVEELVTKLRELGFVEALG